MKKILIIGLLLHCLNLYAHPHVFIDAATTIKKAAANELIIETEWIFDGITSESLLIELDLNANKKIDKSEQEKGIRNFKKNLSMHNYMIELYFGNSKKTEEFKVFNSSFSTRNITFEGEKFIGVVYKFNIKAKVKSKNKKIDFKLRYYDPTFYSEIAAVGKIKSVKGVKILKSKLSKIKSMYEVELAL